MTSKRRVIAEGEGRIRAVAPAHGMRSADRKRGRLTAGASPRGFDLLALGPREQFAPPGDPYRPEGSQIGFSTRPCSKSITKRSSAAPSLCSVRTDVPCSPLPCEIAEWLAPSSAELLLGNPSSVRRRSVGATAPFCAHRLGP